MPAFGRDKILDDKQIGDLVSFVRAISRQQQGSAAAKRGAPLFAQNCAACHGPDAKGNREFGAPNLTDAIWLYGGDEEAIRKSIHDARNGVMPRWDEKLDPTTIKMLSAYVHSLGGGEVEKVQTARK